MTDTPIAVPPTGRLALRIDEIAHLLGISQRTIDRLRRGANSLHRLNEQDDAFYGRLKSSQRGQMDSRSRDRPKSARRRARVAE